MSTYNFNGYRLNLKNTYKQNRDDKWIIQYSLVNPEGKVLFSGKDFHSSPLYKPTGKQSAIALLGFLTLKKGDTDSEYFDNYTPEQLAFSKSADCEELACIVYDYENAADLEKY